MNRQPEAPDFELARSTDSTGRSIFFDHDRAQLLDDVLKAHDYERERLGQELHDSAGQLLVSLHLSIARLRIDGGGSRHEELIDDIQETVRRIDQEIRSLAFLHHPVELDGRDLSAAVSGLVAGFGKRTGISAGFRSIGDCSNLDRERATALLRIAQEALVNVHRHARASSVSVVLRRLVGDIELSVTDDGVGIPPPMLERAHGIGLQGMRHRAEVFAGRFQAGNTGDGTKIVARIPLETRAA